VIVATACAATAVVQAAVTGAHAIGPKAPKGVRVTVIARGIPLPTSFAFAPGGRVFVGAAGKACGNVGCGPRGGVYLLRPKAAARQVLTVSTGAAVAWSAGRLFVATRGRLDSYSDFDGLTFSGPTTLLSGLPNWVNGVAAGPGGRIWVAMGGDCDTCAATAELAQAVVAVPPDGGAPTVVARRLRQPYGIAFPAGSSVPFVTAVGQDNLGEDAPPDAIVRATAGADFGFPMCNWTRRSSCASFTRPTALLLPHTTPTGIAVIGADAFVGTYGYNSVLRMPLKGSQPKPFLTAFPSPVVAVGANRGDLYVGTVAGTIYRVRP
jgi:glucose/arabinose dehydrogenase